MTTTIMISGGFDPLHGGHIDYIKAADKYGKVIVALNSDEWLLRKKGYFVLPYEERDKILSSLEHIYAVVSVDDADGTVCEAIMQYSPDYFGNGGDRVASNTPELSLCQDMGVEPIFNLGGNKTNSSSAIMTRAVGQRPWGSYSVLYSSKDFQVKVLTVNPKCGISIQRHKHRNEHWIFPKTDAYSFVRKGDVHCLHNPEDEPIQVVEVQTGSSFDESDIEKFYATSIDTIAGFSNR